MRTVLLLLAFLLSAACGGRDASTASDGHWILGRILRAGGSGPTIYTVEVVDPLRSPWRSAAEASFAASSARTSWSGEPVVWGPDGRSAVLLLQVARGDATLAIASRGPAHRNVAAISRIRAGGEP